MSNCWSRPTRLWLCALTSVGLGACTAASSSTLDQSQGDDDGGVGRAPAEEDAAAGGGDALSEAEILERLARLSPASLPGPLPDGTNRYADDPAAAELGQKFFFEPRFSGPLLDSDNTGLPGTLGAVGETGRVACVSCHNPKNAFDDRRSPKAQISLGAGWTRRRAPSLLDFGQTRLLMWDGRRDTGHTQPIGVIQNPLEFNSSLSFVAQQVARYYRAEYEAVFGEMPEFEFDEIAPEDAGCRELEAGPLPKSCTKPSDTEPDVIRVVINVGKAISAYERLLTCGPSRFDAWMAGESDALTQDEQAGARWFIRAGCDTCHSGPFLSDQEFHNLGAANRSVNFIEPYDDPGAVTGLAAMLLDPLNSRGEYSDGYDGRLDVFTGDLEDYRGAFRTPTLRCVGQRPSFLHAGQARSLEDVLYLLNDGGNSSGYQGEKAEEVVALGLDSEAIAQLAAFLRALDGPGPTQNLRDEPELPE